jgi:hypothetical protein
MKHSLAALCLWSTAAAVPIVVSAEQIDARPPDRLTITANGSTLSDSDGGQGGSLNGLHYFTPDAIVGAGVEYQSIADARFAFGSLRGSWSTGKPSSRFNVNGEVQYGSGEDDGGDFDYAVGVLGIGQNITSKLSLQLETRQIDIDTTHGNLPKLGVTYVFSPRVVGNVSYANSVGGNLGTELITTRADFYGAAYSFLIGAASGSADPNVVRLQPGLTLPTRTLKQGFIGVGRTFGRSELRLLADYLELGDSEKATLTMSFIVSLGSRGR